MISINSFSQDSLYFLHNSTGKKIDKAEKKKYCLYPDIADSLFIEAVFIQLNDSTFRNEILIREDSILSVGLRISHVDSMRQNIAKLNDYYYYLENRDSLQIAGLDSLPNPNATDEKLLHILNQPIRSSEFEFWKQNQSPLRNQTIKGEQFDNHTKKIWLSPYKQTQP